MKRKLTVTVVIMSIFIVLSINVRIAVAKNPDEDIIHVDHHRLEKYGIDNSTIPDFDSDMSADEKVDFQELEKTEKSESMDMNVKETSDTSTNPTTDSKSSEVKEEDVVQDLNEDSLIPESKSNKEQIEISSDPIVTSPEWLIVMLLGFLVIFAYNKKKIY